MAKQSSEKWRHFQKLSFDSKKISKRVRRAEGLTLRHAKRFLVRRWGNIRQVRIHIAVWLLAIGVLIGAAGLQLLWNRSEYVGRAYASGGTYAEAVMGPVSTLNPLFASSPAENAAARLMFSSLLAYDQSGRLNNDVAKKVTVDETGTVYTVELRPDVFWHDDTHLTAKDVVFTVNTLKDPVVRSTISGWDGVEAKQLDEFTVQFKLQSPYAAFRHALTFPIIPAHVFNGVATSQIRESSFSSAPIGTGPMMFRLVQDVSVPEPRKIIHLVKNPRYYKGTAKLSKFQLHTYSDRHQILQALTVGEVNAASDLQLRDTKGINPQRYETDVRPIQAGVYALFNTESSVLQDGAVRRALQAGTNTAEVRKKLANQAPALDLPFTEGQLTGEIPKAPAYDKTAAEKILDEAGWERRGEVRKKGDVELRLSFVTTNDSEFERATEILAGQWRSLGVAVDVRIIDPSDVSQNFVQSILQARGYDVLLYQLSIGGDPDVFAYWHSSQATARGFNFSNYTNVVSDDALASARLRYDPALRNAKYLSFARQWLADAPAIGLYQSTMVHVHSRNTHSNVASLELVTPQDRYNNVLYWSEGTRSVYKTP